MTKRCRNAGREIKSTTRERQRVRWEQSYLYQRHVAEVQPEQIVSTGGHEKKTTMSEVKRMSCGSQTIGEVTGQLRAELMEASSRCFERLVAVPR